MAKQNFEAYSNSNCYAETIINLPGGQIHSDLFNVSISNVEPKITISIETNNVDNKGPEHSANFLFYEDNFQQIVDWLRNKGLIK